MHRGKVVWLVLTTAFLIYGLSVKSQEDDKFKDKGLVVNIDLDKADPLKANALVYPIDQLIKPILEKDTMLLRFMDELEPGVFRFPPAHVANFFNPNTSLLELSEESLRSIKDSSISNELLRYQKLYKKENILDEVLDFVRSRNASLLYVANLYTGDTTDLKLVLKKVKNSGLSLSGIEMGYRLYQKPYRDVFKKADSYLSKAESFHAIINQQLEDVPVALCLSPLKKFQRDPSDDAENSKWNSKLSEASFHDAWSISLSYDVGKCYKKDDVDRIYDCVFDGFLDYVNKDVPEYFVKLQENYRKELWVNSFGLSHQAEMLQNSFLEANVVFDLAKAMIDQNLRDTFMITRYGINKSYHSSAYRSLFSRKLLIEKEVDNRAKIYKRAAYFPLYFLKGISNKKSEKLIGSGASNIPNLIKTGKFSFTGFYNPDKITAHFYMVNKTDIPLRLDAIYFKGRLRYRGSTGKVETFKYTAGEWYSSYGVNSWVKESELYDNSELYMVYDGDKVQPRDFIIPPKSIYYIRIRVK